MVNVTNKDVKKLQNYFVKYGLDRAFMKDSGGRLITNLEYYKWLLSHWDIMSYAFCVDVWDYNAMRRFDVSRLCDLFGRYAVRTYCEKGRYSYDELADGFGSLEAVGKRDDITDMAMFINGMYSELMRNVRTGAEFECKIKEVVFTSNGLMVIFWVEFLPGNGVKTGYGGYNLLVKYGEGFVIDWGSVDYQLKDYVGRYYINEVWVGGEVGGYDGVKNRILECVVGLLNRLNFKGVFCNGHEVKERLFVGAYGNVN